MDNSLSIDIRERVVAVEDEGMFCHEAARCLRISSASAVRIGNASGVRGAGRTQDRPRRSKLDMVSNWLKTRV